MVIFAGTTGFGHLPISFPPTSIIPQGITGLVGLGVGAGRVGAGVVVTDVEAFVSGMGLLPVTAGLDVAFVVGFADVVDEVDGVAAAEGEVEALVDGSTFAAPSPAGGEVTEVVTSESSVLDSPHPVSTPAIANATPAMRAFLFMLDLSLAQCV